MFVSSRRSVSVIVVRLGTLGVPAPALMRGPAVIGPEPCPGKFLSRSIRLSWVSSLSLPEAKSPRWRTCVSNRQIRASSNSLKPPAMAGKLLSTCSEVFSFKLLSSSTTAESGNGSTEKRVICCSTPSSSTRNSFWCRSSTSLPVESFTVTGTTTNSTVVRMRARGSSCCSAPALLPPPGHTVKMGGGGGARGGVPFSPPPGGRGDPPRHTQRQDFPWRSHAWPVSTFPAYGAGFFPRVFYVWCEHPSAEVLH